MSTFMDHSHRENPLLPWEQAILRGHEHKHLNVYEKGLEYGGPEEGGWTYPTGRFVPEMSAIVSGSVEFVSLAASALADQLTNDADTNRIPAVHSVMYRGGRYAVHIEDGPGADFPAERPYYS